VDVQVTYTNLSGANVKTVVVTVPRQNQIAAFLNQPPFNAPPSFTGTVTMNAGGRRTVGIIALRGLTNERGDFLLTTLPVIPLGNSLGPVLIPQFAAGGGWTTQLALVNPTNEILTGTIQFYDSGSTNRPAGPVSVLIDGEMADTFNYSIRPASAQKVSVTLTGETQVGSVRITPAPSTLTPSGILTYSFRGNGVTLSETGVALARTAKSFRIFAERSPSPRLQTGIAMANPSEVPVSVTLDLLNPNGSRRGRTSVTIPPNGQIARYLHEFPELGLPPSFQGLVEVSASSDIALSATRGHFNERGDYFETTLLPVDEFKLVSGSERLFPHLVNGGGYTTKLVLFSGNTNESGEGVLRVFDPSGQPAELVSGTIN